MKELAPVARFPLPDDWEPEGTICAVVCIPDDPQYLSTLIGLLDALKWSTSFDRDPTKSGAATVARTWRAAIETRPIVTKKCEDIDMSIDFRVKPGVPWVSQCSTDGGETWHDYQILPNWSGISNVIAPPVTDQASADNNAGALVRYYWSSVVQDINDGLDGGEAEADTVNRIISRIAPYAQPTQIPLLQTLYNTIWSLLHDMSTGDRMAWVGDCNYISLWDEMRAFIHANPATWLDGLSNWLSEHLDIISSDLAIALNETAAILGGGALWQFAANGGGGGGGGGFGDTCEWTHTFDFTANYGGWVPSVDEFPDPAGDDAVYSSGCCWSGVLAGSGAYVVGVIRTPSGVRGITHLHAKVTVDADYTISVFFRAVPEVGGWSLLAVDGGPAGGGVDVEHDWPISPTTDVGQFHIQIGPNPGTTTELIEFSVSGTGLDPF